MRQGSSWQGLVAGRRRRIAAGRPRAAGLGTGLAAAACWAAVQTLGGGLPAQAAQSVAAPAAKAPAPVQAPGPTFKLSVAGGSGGGDFAPNAVVHIWADPPAAGSVFERWTGDVTPLIDRRAAHTTVVMPRTNLALQALFKPAPACTPVTENLHGVAATWCLPAGQKALILLFHGHEGNGAGFFRATEPRIFAGDAAAAGFGLIALDSADRDHKMWRVKAPGGLGTNADLENVRFVLAELAKRREIDPREPLYGLGVAHGGAFAVHAAHTLQLRAVAVFGAPGALPAQYATPTLWLMTQGTVQGSRQGTADRTPRALSEYDKLAQRHVPAKLEVNDPSPVYPLRFWRIAGLTAEDSRRIHQLLVDRGYLDAHDMLKEDPETSGWEVALPPRLAKIRAALREQLDVCFAIQRFYSDLDHRILDFFREQR
jgi:hypothetical protein